MWALGFWLDGFLPIWLDPNPIDTMRFDLGFNIGPAWKFRKGTLVSYVKTISYWRYTDVKR